MQQSSAGSQSNSLSQDISASSGTRTLVLDTNVVLDLLVFRDPLCHPLVDKLERGTLRWFATAPMRAEFDDVLARPAFERWAGRREQFAAQWSRWAVMVESTPVASHRPELRCLDPDDQMFLDLALGLRPSHLLSRDRELLCLAASASALGVRIGTPAAFGAP